MPARKDIKKILIIGSGAIVIGQACEFDYSGTQAVKALKEEGYEVVLINPNPATVMTTPGIADKIYMEPLEINYTERIIEKERPDAILPTMGGQTGLNLTIALSDAGILEKYNLEVIGASIESIRLAEDRGEFKKVMEKIGLESAESIVASNTREALRFREKIGLPVVIRPSYTLGGMGGSIAYTDDQFEFLVNRAFQESPVGEALIEESLIGWKELEMEVMRDRADNAVIICSIENVDPMGIHTGDSITVAPIQTLSDLEYQKIRTASIDVIRAVGVDCGGSNVQFAVHPGDGRIRIIEMNPRVSRSSALASKATGFPIAYCSAMLAIGYTLDEIINDITGKTVSCFEPALDYCAVKVPRFEIEKFPSGYVQLGTQMKSVGEALALGRTFNEALNKAIISAEAGFDGLSEIKNISDEDLNKILTTFHPLRLHAVFTVLKNSGRDSLKGLSEKTAYDPWFLHNLLELAELESTIQHKNLSPEILLEGKRNGISDRKISLLSGKKISEILTIKEKNGISPSYHFVDTCAGEFTANTPYFYSTYGECDEGTPVEGDSVIILGSGPNRIGQGLEFDTCCTLASIAYRKEGVKTILINSNPETVSTDYNTSDRLYIEPLVFENVRSIMEKEGVKDVVVQLGGQTPLNMAEELGDTGANIIGTSVKSIFLAEDRGLFAGILEKLNLHQPENAMAKNYGEILEFSIKIGFPVLLRPSFVLGGRSMFIAYNESELNAYLARGLSVSSEKPVLVDKFLEDAFEYDLDAVSDGKYVYIGGIMQHIEAAGVHSGDSACVFPPFKSKPEIEEKMVHAAVAISRELKISGFINIQFAEKDDKLYVLEVNPRGSRTIPFLSKVSGVNLIEAAVKVWSGKDLFQQGLIPRGQRGQGYAVGRCIKKWAVKEAVFSFDRFSGLDPMLGPEMKSTGEVMGFGGSFGEAFSRAQAAAGAVLPIEGRVFVSVNKNDRKTILPAVRKLRDLGFSIAATRGTAQFLYDNGIFAEVILKIDEGHPNVIDHMKSGRIDLLINTPLGRFSQMGDHDIRIEAVKKKIPYTTTTSAAEAAVEGILYLSKKEINVDPL